MWCLKQRNSKYVISTSLFPVSEQQFPLEFKPKLAHFPQKVAFTPQLRFLPNVYPFFCWNIARSIHEIRSYISFNRLFIAVTTVTRKATTCQIWAARFAFSLVGRYILCCCGRESAFRWTACAGVSYIHIDVCTCRTVLIYYHTTERERGFVSRVRKTALLRVSGGDWEQLASLCVQG